MTDGMLAREARERKDEWSFPAEAVASAVVVVRATAPVFPTYAR